MEKLDLRSIVPDPMDSVVISASLLSADPLLYSGLIADNCKQLEIIICIIY